MIKPKAIIESNRRYVLIPGAEDDGLLDSATLNLDFTGGRLDSRIDFQRTTVGTYYRGQFNQNLVLHSEAFDNWLKNTAGDTVTVNAGTAPNGTTTADKIIPDATSGAHGVYRGTNVSGSTTYTQSVYVKADGFNWFYMTEGGWLTATVWFNVAAGTLGTVQGTGSPSATITAVGNGWYRCTMTFTTLSTQTTANFQVRPTTGNNIFTGYAGNGVNGILAWGAQQTEGSLLTPYIPTTTAAITQGQIASSQPWNQILRSQEFNVTWTAGNTTVTADATAAPNGTITADKVIANTTNSGHSIYQGVAVVSGVTYTHSVFAKASEYTKMWMIPQATGTIAITEYDLSTGTSTLVSGTATHSITNVGNGWYRCSVTFTATGTGTGYIQMNLVNASGLQNFAGDNTSGTFFWGAQVNEGSSALDYRSTTSSALWLPRFENDPVTGEARGLLIEGGATNLCLQSAAVRTSPWNVLQLTAAGSSITAPDGTASGTEVVINNGVTSGNGYIYQDITAAASTTYTASVYIKIKGTSQNTRIECDALNSAGTNIGTFGVTFTHSSETIGAVSATGWTAQSGTLTNVGNGWYRVTITATSPATTAKIRWFMYSASTGNGTDGRYLWGAQMEAQAFASSYIPTTTATVARGADSAVMTGTNFSSWYNQSEGTVLVDGLSNPSPTFEDFLSIDDGAINNSLRFLRSNSGAGGAGTDATFVMRTLGTLQIGWFGAASLGAFASGTTGKYCVGFVANDGAGVFNNGTLQTDNVFTPPTVNRMTVSGLSTASHNIRRIAYWPTRLPNATLQSLTT